MITINGGWFLSLKIFHFHREMRNDLESFFLHKFIEYLLRFERKKHLRNSIPKLKYFFLVSIVWTTALRYEIRPLENDSAVCPTKLLRINAQLSRIRCEPVSRASMYSVVVVLTFGGVRMEFSISVEYTTCLCVRVCVSMR